MKAYKFINVLILISIFLVGCDDLDYKPIDQLDESMVVGDTDLLQNVTYGTYSKLKIRNYLRYCRYAKELMSDDVILVKTTGDHLMQTYNYGHTVNSNVSRLVWTIGYQAIYTANKVIEAIDEQNSDTRLRQLLGENIFLRALIHHDLVRIFGRPYTNGDPSKNLGVMIRDNIDPTDLPPRSTVKECYDFIVADLLKAATLMTEPKPDIYASKEVAYALLARIYIYMADYDNAIKYADMVINSGRYELLQGNDYKKYFTFIPEENKETIFAIKLLATENQRKGSVGSMFNGFGGWGELYVSPSYRKLIYKYSNDARINFIQPHYKGNKIPDPTEDCGFKVQKRNGLSKYYNVKYTMEDGIPMLASIIRLRLAEMYLIKAEAYAKKGDDSKAIEIVDLLRQRAGLTGDQLFSNNMQGYTSTMDIVMDELRLEFAWEGHRSYDVYRNNRTMDRTYLPPDVAWHGPRIIEPTSKAIVHLIPESEIILNPNLVQNPF